MAKRVTDELREKLADKEEDIENLEWLLFEAESEVKAFRDLTAELLAVTKVQDYKTIPEPDSIRAVIKAIKEKA